MNPTGLDRRKEPASTLQFALVGVGVGVGLCAFLLALAAAFGGAGLFFGSLALTVVIVLVLRRNRKRGGQAISPVTIEELSLNTPLLGKTWRKPVNLGGATALGILLIAFAVILAIVGWPLWAVALAVITTAAVSFMGMLGLYLAGYFMMFAFTRLAGGELGVAAQLGKKRRHEEALAFCRRYTNRRPNDPAGWAASCIALWQLRRLEDALVDADRAAKLGGGDQAKMLRGILCTTFGLHGEAAEDLSENPYRAQTLRYLGHSLAVLRRLDEAIVVLREGSALTDRAEEYLQLGEAYRLQGNVQGSSMACAKAIECAFAGRTEIEKPEATAAYCLVRIGKVDEAERHADSALREVPREPLALLTLAIVSILRGDIDAAYAFIQQMLAIRPDAGIWAFRDRQFTPLLAERRFRELFAWAWGAHRQVTQQAS